MWFCFFFFFPFCITFGDEHKVMSIRSIPEGCLLFAPHIMNEKPTYRRSCCSGLFQIVLSDLCARRLLQRESICICLWSEGCHEAEILYL